MDPQRSTDALVGALGVRGRQQSYSDYVRSKCRQRPAMRRSWGKNRAL